MLNELEIFRGTGNVLIEVVGSARATAAVYSFGKKQIDVIRGFVGDQQEANLRSIWAKAKDKLRGAQEERLSEPSASIITPLIEGAIQERREELQTLWAGLLANAMLDGSAKVRREYIETLQKLEPLDVIILKIIQQPLPATAMVHSGVREEFNRIQLEAQNIGQDDFFVSTRALTRLGCLFEGVSNMAPILTPFARKLLDACDFK